MLRSKRPNIVQIITLDIQRRHVKTCLQYGKKPYRDCPSAAKKKCPYRLFGIGIDENGNRQKIRKSLGTNNQQAATALLVEYRLRIEMLNAVVAREMLVSEAMSQYFTEEAARGVSGSTLTSFHKFLDRRRNPKQFSPTLIMYAEENGLKRLSQITPEHLKQWRSQWKVGNKTATKQWERVRQFFAYAQDAGWININPAAKIRNLVDSRDDLPVTALSSEEVVLILNACGKNEYARTFLLTLLYSGIAMVDAVQLKPDRLEGDHLRLYRTKTGAWVKVKLPSVLLDRLRQLPVRSDGFWFWNRRDGESKHQTATGNMRRMLRPIYRRSGVLVRDKRGNPVPMLERKTGAIKRDSAGNIVYTPVHSHQWRHTFVHNHLKQGTPIEVVAKLIGDTVKVVSDTYAEFIEERQALLDKHTESTWPSEIGV